MQRSRFACIFVMDISVGTVRLVVLSSLVNYLPVNVMLIRIQAISRITWWQATASAPTYQPLVSVRIRSCKSTFLCCAVVGLLSRVAVVVLVAADSPLTVLTHWNELLIRISLALWRHVLLENFSLNLLIVVVN